MSGSIQHHCEQLYVSLKWSISHLSALYNCLHLIHWIMHNVWKIYGILEFCGFLVHETRQIRLCGLSRFSPTCFYADICFFPTSLHLSGHWLPTWWKSSNQFLCRRLLTHPFLPELHRGSNWKSGWRKYSYCRRSNQTFMRQGSGGKDWI